MHKADEYAAAADTRGIERINYLGIAFIFVFYFVIAFLPIYLGGSKAQAIVSAIPVWLISGLKVAGAMMPAVGFAMLLKIMLKKEYIAFLLIGFILVTYGHLTILPVALVGTAFALYDFFASKDRGDDSSNKEGITDGI